MTPTKAVVLAQPRDAGPARSGALPPAPLLHVANRSLLSHALTWLGQAGVRDAVVVVPHDLAGPTRAAAGAAPAGIELSWLEQLPGESLPQVLSELTGFLEGEPFVLHLADSVARGALRSLSSLAPDPDLDAVLMLDGSEPDGGAQVIALHSRRPAPSALHAARGGGAGVAMLAARAFERLDDLDAPPARFLESLLERIEQTGGQVTTRPVHDWWRFRGGAEALLAGNRFALERLRASYDADAPLNSVIQGAVQVHPDARIESSVVRGPAIIGARAQLRDAYVGPYTAVGDDVVIDGAEVENSVLLPHSSVRHLGGRLEASLLGAGARVQRDFRLPRAFRVLVGEGAEVSLT